jgi:hypothetical protein
LDGWRWTGGSEWSYGSELFSHLLVLVITHSPGRRAHFEPKWLRRAEMSKHERGGDEERMTIICVILLYIVYGASLKWN